MIVGIIEKHQTSQHPEEVKEDHMVTMRAQKKSSEAVFFCTLLLARAGV
jgi:hypothetical protein